MALRYPIRKSLLHLANDMSVMRVRNFGDERWRGGSLGGAGEKAGEGGHLHYVSVNGEKQTGVIRPTLMSPPRESASIKQVLERLD
jgi:hypothetical protein